MEERIEFAIRAMRTLNFRALCQEYGISAKTGYKWRERFWRKSLRLLLVEDHDETRRTLSRLLSRCGHKVSSTDHAESALKFLDSKRFDAVVSDIGLPDHSGYELIALAKQRHHLKGIALSGFGMEEDVRRSFAAGFDHHLTKPVDFRNLRSLLNEITV